MGTGLFCGNGNVLGVDRGGGHDTVKGLNATDLVTVNG